MFAFVQSSNVLAAVQQHCRSRMLSTVSLRNSFECIVESHRRLDGAHAIHHGVGSNMTVVRSGYSYSHS